MQRYLGGGRRWRSRESDHLRSLKVSHSLRVIFPFQVGLHGVHAHEQEPTPLIGVPAPAPDVCSLLLSHPLQAGSVFVSKSGLISVSDIAHTLFQPLKQRLRRPKDSRRPLASGFAPWRAASLSSPILCRRRWNGITSLSPRWPAPRPSLAGWRAKGGVCLIIL